MSVYSAPEGGLARSARRLSAGRKAGAVTGDVQTASGRVKERDRDPVRSRGGVRLAAGAGGDQGRGRIFGSGPGGPGRGCSELPLDGAPSPPASWCRVLRLRSRCSSTRVASADFCSLDTKLSTSSMMSSCGETRTRARGGPSTPVCKHMPLCASLPRVSSGRTEPSPGSKTGLNSPRQRQQSHAN